MPGQFSDEFVNGIRNEFCTVMGIARNFYPYALRIRSPYVILPLTAAYFAHRIFCNEEPPGQPDPPFTGGQCEFAYNVSINFTNQGVNFITGCTPQDQSTVVNFVLGPIKGLEVTFEDAPAPFVRTSYLKIVHGVNSELRTVAYSYSGYGVCEPNFPAYSIVSVVPSGGQPDECGDPPPGYGNPDPGYNERDVTITYTTNNGDDVNFTFNFVFAPITVNLNGSLIIPLRIRFGDDNTYFSGDINVEDNSVHVDWNNVNYPSDGHETPGNYPTPDNLPDYPPDVPQPISPPSTTDPPTMSTSVIRACIVTVTEDEQTSTTIIYQDNNPDIYAPNLGYVQFLIATGNTTAWTSDIPVKNKRNFIPCSWPAGAIGVRGTPREGVTWSITPIYASIDSGIDFTVYS